MGKCYYALTRLKNKCIIVLWFYRIYYSMNNLIENQLLYLCTIMKENNFEIGKTKIFKLFWFANLLMADTYWKLIIQDVFLKDKYWPVPVAIKDYVELVIEKNEQHRHSETPFQTTEKHIGQDDYWVPIRQISFQAIWKYNNDYLTDIDKEVFAMTVKKYWMKSATELSSITHKEWWAWDKAEKHKTVDISLDMQNKDLQSIVKETYSDYTRLYAMSFTK